MLDTYYSDELIRVLKVNLRFWYLDPTSWLRDNLPTLAKYL